MAKDGVKEITAAKQGSGYEGWGRGYLIRATLRL